MYFKSSEQTWILSIPVQHHRVHSSFSLSVLITPFMTVRNLASNIPSRFIYLVNSPVRSQSPSSLPHLLPRGHPPQPVLALIAHVSPPSPIPKSHVWMLFSLPRLGSDAPCVAALPPSPPLQMPKLPCPA